LAKPFNAKSGFVHKQLSDGPTFTAGTACAFSCRYCYVESLIFKQPRIRALLAHTQAPFDRLVIRRRQPLNRKINSGVRLTRSVTPAPNRRTP
jgi:DNA repair photolyase